MPPPRLLLRRDFGKVFHVGQTFEVGILCPEGGMVAEGCRVDEGIGHGQFVLHAQCCGERGDFCRDGADLILLQKGKDLLCDCFS